MKYTLSQARNNQDEAKRKADEATDASSRRNHMNDVLFWTGYMAAMVDHDFEKQSKETLTLTFETFVNGKVKNLATAKIELNVPKAELADYLEKFGFDLISKLREESI